MLAPRAAPPQVIATFVSLVYGMISVKATTEANNYGEAVVPLKKKRD